MRRDAGSPADAHVEEGADPKLIALPSRFGEAFIGLEIAAVKIEFGRGVPAIGAWS